MRVWLVGDEQQVDLGELISCLLHLPVLSLDSSSVGSTTTSLPVFVVVVDDDFGVIEGDREAKDVVDDAAVAHGDDGDADEGLKAGKAR